MDLSQINKAPNNKPVPKANKIGSHNARLSCPGIGQSWRVINWVLELTIVATKRLNKMTITNQKSFDMKWEMPDITF